ncbi:MAG: hypothetical protein EXS31_10610 [Pedosphaera sp.]|nr:hypothetical protein [Pedosphaera sp.]
MKTTPERLIELFGQASQKAPAEQAAFLDQVCRGEPELRRQLETLLQSHAEAGAFLEEAAATEIGPHREDAPLLEQAGSVIGRYKLLQKIGEGGCGVVYMAEQEQPVRRRVALKVIKAGMDTKSVIARFEAERQALAMMDHPNIAKVFDGGATENGRPYFVMELVRGIKITEYCDENNLSTRDRLGLFTEVCQAIQHAHQKGIIHRDIKPSNVLVTVNDGKPVPKVIDFGIAKATEQRLTDKTLFTAFEQFIGTPAYMSPEQAGMTSLDIDTRSDIYSLGVLLYELLAGSTPFDAKELMASGFDAMRKTIREKEPLRPSTRLTQEWQRQGSARVSRAESGVAPDSRSSNSRSSEGSELNEGFGGTPQQARGTRALPEHLQTLINALRGDLDWIVMKCLEKDRTRRYETANGLAADLNRHLNNEPVLARPPSAVYKFQKAFRRNKLVFAAGTAIAVALVVGVMVSTWQAVRAARAERMAQLAEQAERIQAEQARAASSRAERAEADALDALGATRRAAYAAEISVAFQALNENALDRARELLDRQRPKAGEEDLRGFEWRYLWQLCRGDELATFLDAGAQAAAFSPDGKFLAYGSKSIVVRSADSRNVIATLPSPATTLSFAPHAKLLASGHQAGVKLWDTEKWQEARSLPGTMNPALFSPDGRWLLTGVEGGFRVWDTQTWQPLGDCAGAPQAGYMWHARNAVAFSPDSQFLITIAGESWPTGDHFRVWRLPGLERLPDLRPDAAEPGSVAFTADGKHVVAGLWDGQIRVWDFATGRIVATLKGHTGWVAAVAMATDGKTFATASADRTIILWDALTFEPRERRRGHVGEVWSLALSPDGRTALSGSTDGTTRTWSTETRQTDQVLGGPNLVAGFTGRGRKLVAVMTNSLCVWTPESGERVDFPIPASAPPILADNWGRPCAVKPNEPFVALGRNDGTIGIWDLTTGATVAVWPAHGDGIAKIKFSPDGRRLATSSTTGEVKIWEFATRRELARLGSLGPGQANALTFTPDGATLISSGNHRFWLWDVSTGHEIPLDGHDGDEVYSVAISPSGELLAVTTGSSNQTRLHELPSGRLLAVLRGHVQGINAVAFSPDGKMLATGSNERRVKLWNVATRQELATFSLGMAIPTLDFSSDGRMLAVGDISSIGRGIKVLLAPTFEEITVAEAKEKVEIKQP